MTTAESSTHQIPTQTDSGEILDEHIQLILVAVEHELRAAKEGISELALIRALQRPPWELIGQVSFHEPESLYPIHFLLFHVLYRLRDELNASDEQLHISPLNIQLTPQATVAGIGMPEGVDQLRQFYLDLSQYELPESAIHKMMDDFWAGRSPDAPAPEDIKQAAGILGFDEVPSEFSVVKLRFRRAVMHAHPDRGGDTEQIQQLNHAFSILKVHFQSGRG